MSFQGHIENGVVVFDEPVTLPEGTAVRVEPAATTPKDTEAPIPTLYERLRSVAGIAKGLPADASVNHDHYLYGHPKQ